MIFRKMREGKREIISKDRMNENFPGLQKRKSCPLIKLSPKRSSPRHRINLLEFSRKTVS